MTQSDVRDRVPLHVYPELIAFAEAVGESTSSEQILSLASSAKSPFQRKNIAWSAGLFERWCSEQQRVSCPVEIDTVVEYLVWRFETCRFATIQSDLAAIFALQRRQGFPTPFNLFLRDLLTGMRRLNTPSVRKLPFRDGEVLKLCQQADRESIAPVAMRNRTFMLMMYRAALRSLSVASLRVSDIHFEKRGMRIRLLGSKNSVGGPVQELRIPLADDERICAVRASRKWFRLLGRSSGPAFPKIKDSTPLYEPMKTYEVSAFVKKYVRLVGLDRTRYSPKSFRYGYVTGECERDVRESVIMRTTLHRTYTGLHAYIDDMDPRAVNVTELLGL